MLAGRNFTPDVAPLPRAGSLSTGIAATHMPLKWKVGEKNLSCSMSGSLVVGGFH